MLSAREGGTNSQEQTMSNYRVKCTAENELLTKTGWVRWEKREALWKAEKA
jgi:hypothetical protein